MFELSAEINESFDMITVPGSEDQTKQVMHDSIGSR